MRKEWHALVLEGVTPLDGWTLVVTTGHEFLCKYVKSFMQVILIGREGFLRNMIDRTRPRSEAEAQVLSK